MLRHRAFPAQDDQLWIKLNEFEFDEPGCEGAFAARLAREQGWTREFTARVIAEYRRFLFLAKRAGHAVTPSTIVDEAWHLHLIFTRSYWDRLCGEVLRMRLHHDPGTGGAEDAKFQGQYVKTLDAYRRWFGEPGAEVWPRREAMESAASGRGSVGLRRAAMIALAGGGITALAGCTAMVATGAGFGFAIVLVGVLVISVVVLVAAGLAKRGAGTRRPAQSGDDGGVSWMLPGFMLGTMASSDAHAGGKTHPGSHTGDGSSTDIGASSQPDSGAASQPDVGGGADGGGASCGGGGASCGGGSSCGGGGGCGGGS
jgi:hypothetical protein